MTISQDMTTGGTGSFTFAGYEETTYGEADGGSKVTSSTVTNTYTGALEGEGKQAYLGVWRPDGATGTWVGLELVTGTIDGHTGSFVLTQQGTFDAEGVTGTWTVVAGAGSGDLAKLRGSGGFTYAMGTSSAAYTLDVDLNGQP